MPQHGKPKSVRNGKNAEEFVLRPDLVVPETAGLGNSSLESQLRPVVEGSRGNGDRGRAEV